VIAKSPAAPADYAHIVGTLSLDLAFNHTVGISLATVFLCILGDTSRECGGGEGLDRSGDRHTISV